MSGGELLLTAVVALCVFGPKQLPELARRLGLAMRFFERLKEKAHSAWGRQQLQLQLLENEQKAQQADELYSKNESTQTINSGSQS